MSAAWAATRALVAATAAARRRGLIAERAGRFEQARRDRRVERDAPAAAARNPSYGRPAKPTRCCQARACGGSCTEAAAGARVLAREASAASPA